MSFEINPNADIDERIRASISSLKELIIIFTGLTITASFAFYINSHLRVLDKNHSSSTLILNSTIIEDSFILLLLILCVMRFYHGNIMILDRYYIIPKQNLNHGREITLDSTAILAMTFGLAFLGLLIQHYAWFFFVYVLITATSVLWGARVNWANFARVLRKSEDAGVPDMLKDEFMTQMNWFMVNSLFLILTVFFSVVAVMSTESVVLTTSENSWEINVHLDSTMFWILSSLVFINSVWDLWVNRKEYFPRKIP